MFSDKRLQFVKRTNAQMPVISMVPNEDGGHNYVISIRGAIDNPMYYASACDVMKCANEKDNIKMLIGTPGGRVDAGIAMVQAMKQCKAIVTTTAVGLVASCGALLWTHGDKIEACRFARPMFHSTSGGYIGKTKDQKDSAIAVEKLFKRMLAPAVEKKLLTQEQFDKAFDKNTDVYLTVNDLDKNGADYALIG